MTLTAVSTNHLELGSVDMKHETEEVVKAGVDALSVFTMIGALVKVLPAIAAIFTIVWTGIRIYETDTVQKLIAKWKNRAK